MHLKHRKMKKSELEREKDDLIHIPALCHNFAFCHSKIQSHYKYLVGLGHLDD